MSFTTLFEPLEMGATVFLVPEVELVVVTADAWFCSLSMGARAWDVSLRLEWTNRRWAMLFGNCLVRSVTAQLCRNTEQQRTFRIPCHFIIGIE